MKKPKLTDVELSKVLSRAATGDLDHGVVSSGARGCVGGTVYDVGEAGEGESPLEYLPIRDQLRLWAISDAVAPSIDQRDYGGDPDAVLRHLEKRGLA